MNVKKHMSVALILSQMFYVSIGTCDTSTPADASVSAEQTLITNVVALRGLGLSHEDWQAQTRNAFEQYQAATPSEALNERFENLAQAYVTTKIYTQAQAQQWLALVEAAQQRLSASNPASQVAAEQGMQTEFSSLMQVVPQGAQFNGSCMNTATNIEYAGMGAFVFGLVGILAQGGSVPVGNWASITAFSGFGLAVVGIAVSYGC